MKNKREIALLIKTEAGWLQVDVTTRTSDVERMIISNLKDRPIDTPYKVQQRIVQHERVHFLNRKETRNG